MWCGISVYIWCKIIDFIMLNSVNQHKLNQGLCLTKRLSLNIVNYAYLVFVCLIVAKMDRLPGKKKLIVNQIIWIKYCQ